VGKTELVKALAEFLFNDEDAMVRFDMSEYKEAHSVSKLIGSPPGYVGYEDAGQLTEAVRRRPYCILLFDEIEKAHPDVCNTLLQVLEDGRLTDSRGVTVSFKETVVIMTSNLGTGMQSRSGMGFAGKGDGREDMNSSVDSELKRFFKPEFLNRIDEVVIFNQLTKANLLKIVELLISEVNALLKERNITLDVTASASEWLIDTGYDPSFGARPLRRTIQRYVTNVISDKILNDELKAGHTVSIYLDEADNKLAFDVVINADSLSRCLRLFCASGAGNHPVAR
jgi:ATP-dependent Clp protease ATP-binding subunit ClpC